MPLYVTWEAEISTGMKYGLRLAVRPPHCDLQVVDLNALNKPALVAVGLDADQLRGLIMTLEQAQALMR